MSGAIDGGASARVRGQSDDMRNANVLPTDRTLASNAEISDTYRTLLQRLEAARAEAKKGEKANPVKPDSGKTDRTAKNAENEKNIARTNGGTTAQELDPLTGRPRVVTPGATGATGVIGTGSGFTGDGSGSLNAAGQGTENGMGTGLPGTPAPGGYRARRA